MKKRWTALLLALAMLSALAVGALADEQKKEESAAETVQTTPDAAGTLSFENLGARMKEKSYALLALEESIALVESTDYEKVEQELRDGLNEIADAQWKMTALGSAGTAALSRVPTTAGSPDASDYALAGAVDAVGGAVGRLASQSLQTQYDALRERFDDVRDGKLQRDNEGVVRQLKSMENNTVQMMQNVYITLLGLEEQSAALARQDAALDRTLAELELRYQLGQISTMTLEQAKAGKIQLESGKATLDMNITALRRQLNAMVGEELTAPLTLGALPAVTAEQLSAMDVEKDLEKAKAASYDLYAAKKTLDDADEEYDDSGAKSYYNERDYKKVQARHKWQSAQYTYNATVQKYELTFRSLCDKVKDCAQILSAAKVSLECERSDLAAAQLKYEQGTISENALHTAEDELYTAQDTVSGAERDLFTAYNNYRWAVDCGLLAG
mgnify:FL=1